MSPKYYLENGKLTTAKTSTTKCDICHRRITRGEAHYQTGDFARAHRPCVERAENAMVGLRATVRLDQTIKTQLSLSDTAIRQHGQMLAECTTPPASDAWLFDGIDPVYLESVNVTSKVA